MQVVLFQEAARRLEGMEPDGGSADAIARGSVGTASAKLIRHLHRIMWRWKNRYAMGAQQHSSTLSTSTDDVGILNDLETPSNVPSYSSQFNMDDPFTDHFLMDWSNWPAM